MITFETTTPNGLLTRIKAAIDNGSIKTWAYDKDGDFTHTAPQWNLKAWMRPTASGSTLELSILGTTTGLSTELYAIYHGRFLEMMLAHFNKSFSASTCTPVSKGADSVVTVG